MELTSSMPPGSQTPAAGVSSPRSGSSKVVLAYRSASQQLCSRGMGMLKLATLHWKQSKTRSEAVVKQQLSSCSPSGGNPSCKSSPLDHLAALVGTGQSRLARLGQEKQHRCKRIVVLGAPRVGKTSILRRYLRDGFVEEYKPTSEDFHRKLFRIRGETYQIDILDASGERSFPAKRRLSILTGA